MSNNRTFNYSAGRPIEGEFHPFYGNYVALVEELNVLQVLHNHGHTFMAFLEGLSEAQWLHRYAPGKWSIKEIAVHLMDSERVFSYRALRIARGDTTPLPGFDQDIFVASSKADKRAVASILAEYRALRSATLELLDAFVLPQFLKMGTASDAPVSVRALAYIMAGHERHHFNIIKERYI